MRSLSPASPQLTEGVWVYVNTTPPSPTPPGLVLQSTPPFNDTASVKIEEGVRGEEEVMGRGGAVHCRRVSLRSVAGETVPTAAVIEPGGVVVPAPAPAPAPIPRKVVGGESGENLHSTLRVCWAETPGGKKPTPVTLTLVPPVWGPKGGEMASTDGGVKYTMGAPTPPIPPPTPGDATSAEKFAPGVVVGGELVINKRVLGGRAESCCCCCCCWVRSRGGRAGRVQSAVEGEVKMAGDEPSTVYLLYPPPLLSFPTATTTTHVREAKGENPHP